MTDCALKLKEKMMDLERRKQIQRQRLKSLLPSLILFTVAMTLLLVGVSAQKTNKTAYIMLFVGALIVAISSLILTFKVTKKYDLIMAQEYITAFKEQIKDGNGKTEFVADNNQTVRFEASGAVIDGETVLYDDIAVYVSVKIQTKAISNRLSLALSIAFNGGNEMVSLPLDADVLSEIERNNVIIENNSDYRHFLDDGIKFTRVMMNQMPVSRVAYFPIAVPKNEQEHMLVKSITKRKTVITALSIVGIFVFYALLIWLFRTDSGLQFSDTLGFNIGFKLAFTVAVLLLALVKPKSVKLHEKILLCVFIVLYWSILIFFTSQAISLLFLIFALIFACVGFVNIARADKKKEKPTSRVFILGMVLSLFVLGDVSSMTFLDDKEIIIELIIALVVFVISIPVTIVYIMKTKSPKYQKTGKKILFGITTPILTFLLAFWLAFMIVPELNYVLDTSEPDIVTEEIIELRRSDDSYYAVVEINEVRIDVSISSSDYKSLSEGDEISVSIRKGAFGLKYCMLD